MRMVSAIHGTYILHSQDLVAMVSLRQVLGTVIADVRDGRSFRHYRLSLQQVVTQHANPEVLRMYKNEQSVYE